MAAGVNRMFVWLERASSINDGSFFLMTGQTADWHDLPASYRGGGGVLPFAEGHAEVKAWRDSAIKKRPMTGVSMSGFNPTLASPNKALIWQQDRSTSEQQPAAQAGLFNHQKEKPRTCGAS
jgi:hypothetical protein